MCLSLPIGSWAKRTLFYHSNQQACKNPCLKQNELLVSYKWPTVHSVPMKTKTIDEREKIHFQKVKEKGNDFSFSCVKRSDKWLAVSLKKNIYKKDEKVIHNQQAELVRSSLFLDTEVGIVPDELNGLACCSFAFTYMCRNYTHDV